MEDEFCRISAASGFKPDAVLQEGQMPYELALGKRAFLFNEQYYHVIDEVEFVEVYGKQ
jgi:hypothetical protein